MMLMQRYASVHLMNDTIKMDFLKKYEEPCVDVCAYVTEMMTTYLDAN